MSNEKLENTHLLLSNIQNIFFELAEHNIYRDPQKYNQEFFASFDHLTKIMEDLKTYINS